VLRQTDWSLRVTLGWIARTRLILTLKIIPFATGTLHTFEVDVMFMDAHEKYGSPMFTTSSTKHENFKA